MAATLGVILPSLFIILIIGTFFTRFQSNPYVQSAFKGIRPAVVALILLAAVKIGRKSIKDWACVGIAVIAFVLVFVFKVHAIYTILGGAVAGLLLYKFFPNLVIKQDDKGGQQ